MVGSISVERGLTRNPVYSHRNTQNAKKKPGRSVNTKQGKYVNTSQKKLKRLVILTGRSLRLGEKRTFIR